MSAPDARMIDKARIGRLVARSRRRGPGDLPGLIAYVGLAPMVAAGLVVVFGGIGPFGAGVALAALKYYSAIVLGFLGGIRWGMAMRVETTARGAMLIAASIVPAFIAVVALLLPDAAGLGLLAAGIAGMGAWDVWSIEAGGGPSWYGRVRLRSTLIAAGIIALALLSLGA